jgi:glycine cleavage system P protein (glycine dehydrogenase) subunit 1
VRCPVPVGEINEHLREQHSIIGGYDLGRDDPQLRNHMLVCVTEMNTRHGIDRLVAALDEVAR